ncbi:MAG: hypothetical protein Q9165_006490 [Trypethelium subeluteriae]
MDLSTTNGFDVPIRGRPLTPRTPPIRSASPTEAETNNSASANAQARNFPGTATSPITRVPNPAQPLNGLSTQAASDRLIVGVDFGTTYSGYTSWILWPGGNGITSDKVPTEIAYDIDPNTSTTSPPVSPPGPISSLSSKPSISTLKSKSSPHNRSSGGGGNGGIKWGFQFKPESPRLRCIKLFLDRNQKLPHFVSPLDTAAQLRRYDKTVMDAVSDYLTQLYRHTLDTLTRRYGASFVESTRVEFVLTVPAVWSDAAKNATLHAAERAGMGSRHELRLISEPEAAAVYTLKAIQPNHLDVGDNFIVCDAGGGTVDLIAYRITQLAPLRVEESAVGTGGLCGSAFLNYRFEDHVRERLGAEKFAQMREKKPKSWMMGLRYFEEFVKRNFSMEEGGGLGGEVNVPFPGLPDDEDAGLDSGFLVMTPEQVEAIFEPVIKEVEQLVEGQVEAIRENGGVVKGIVLVGGFGQSNYLYQRLKAHFNSAPPPPYTERPTHQVADAGAHRTVEVMQPLYAWTAVVRGAVLRGLEGSMVGTPISPDQPISFHYTRNFRPNQSLVVEDDLIACADDMPPDAYARGLINVCTLTTDLNAVPKSLFTRLTTTKGVEFDNLDFTLDMRIESAGLVFELKVDGVRYGSVEAEFH